MKRQGFGQSGSGLVAMTTFANNLAPAAQAVDGAAQAAGSALPHVAASTGANLGGSVGGVAAGVGKAGSLGGLSVPASWTSVKATTTPGVATLTNATAISAAFETGSEGAADKLPVAPPFGQFVNGGRGRKLPAYGFRLSFMTKPPAAG
jgi:hypothetical protein